MLFDHRPVRGQSVEGALPAVELGVLDAHPRAAAAALVVVAPGRQPAAAADELGFQPARHPERRRQQKKRWFRRAQRWRAGSEGRISLLKRRHGLDRCRYRGPDGMKRWVGLGVLADNLINMGRLMAACDSS